MNKYLFKDGKEIKKFIPGGYSENMCVGGNAISNGEYFAGDTPKAFDGDMGTDWQSLESRNYTKDTSWIGYEFLTDVHVKKIFSKNYRMPLSVGVERWEESTLSWEEVLRVNDYSLRGWEFEIDLPDSLPSSKWRLIARDRINTNSGSDRWTLYEIKMYEYIDSDWGVIGDLASKELFDLHGMSDLSLINDEAIQQLSSEQVELLCWTDEVESPSRQVVITGLPHHAPIVSSSDISLEEAEKITLSTNQATGSVIRIAVSSDDGVAWKGKSALTLNDTELVKANGFTPEELNALTKEQLASLFPNGTARFAFYLEQENVSDVVEIQSLSVDEKVYTISPTATDLSVIYEVLQEEKPTLYASRDDGVSWKEISQDEMASLSEQPEGDSLRVKAVLKNGQEIHALSYAWA